MLVFQIPEKGRGSTTNAQIYRSATTNTMRCPPFSRGEIRVLSIVIRQLVLINIIS
jgi:hypothetical protein